MALHTYSLPKVCFYLDLASNSPVDTGHAQQVTQSSVSRPSQPDTHLLFHTMFSVFIAIALLGLVYILRSEIAGHVKGETSAVPPVQAYSIEVRFALSCS